MLLRCVCLLGMMSLVAGYVGQEKDQGKITFLMEDDVVILEPWVVDQFKIENPNSMILLYGKGCGSCQWMMGAYKEAAKAAKEAGLKVAYGMINGQAYKDFSRTLGTVGFPHVHVHAEKAPWGYKYEGKMDGAGLLEEMRQHSDGSYQPRPDKTITLTDKTYNDFINKDWALVLYTSNRNDNFMYPFINEVIHDMTVSGEDMVPIGVLNVTSYKGIAKAEHATASIGGFRYGVFFEFYPQTNIADMKKHILRRSALPSQGLTVNSDPELVSRFLEGEHTEDVLMVMLPGADRTREVYDKWTQWCYNNEHIACAHSFDPKLAKKYKIKGFTLLWTRPDMFVHSVTQKAQVSIPKTPFKKDVNFATIWNDDVKDNFLPLVGNFDMEHFKDMAMWITNTIVVCYFNVDLGDGYEKTKHTMRKIGSVAEKYFHISKDSPNGNFAPVRFAVADEISNMELMQRFGLFREEHDDDPLIVIHNAYNHTKHTPTQEEQYEKNMKFETYLESVVDRYLNGTLPPYLRSQPPPTRQTVPVNTVVRSTIDAVIMDETKDVLVFFTQKTDCDECAILEKWLDEIAESVATREPNMKIVKIDISKNDLDRKMFIFQKAPKLYMVPGGKKLEEAHPYPYLRDMNKPQIKGFMGHFAVHSFKSCQQAKKKTESVDDLMKATKKPKKDEL